jgi:hypothetical protein
VAQHQEFDILRRRRTPKLQQQAQQPEEDQVEQTQRHNSQSCPDGQAHRSSRSEAQADFWNPTGDELQDDPVLLADAFVTDA